MVLTINGGCFSLRNSQTDFEMEIWGFFCEVRFESLSKRETILILPQARRVHLNLALALFARTS
jgi:hypothetical protein